jgi:uncharacterized protein YjiS (DUF1127 family)
MIYPSTEMIPAPAGITNTKAFEMSTRRVTRFAGIALPTRPTLSDLLRRVTLMRAAHRQRLALARLDAAALADIGITPDEACAEARRPAWDIPQRWQK